MLPSGTGSSENHESFFGGLSNSPSEGILTLPWGSSGCTSESGGTAFPHLADLSGSGSPPTVPTPAEIADAAAKAAEAAEPLAPLSYFNPADLALMGLEQVHLTTGALPMS